MNYIKQYSLFVALLAAIGCSVPQAPYKAVCEVTVGGARGSGTLIAVEGHRALVLTARHVAERVDNSAKIRFPFATGRNAETSGTVLAIQSGSDFPSDMALIICERPAGLSPLQIAEFNPDNGPWRSYGYRGGKLYQSIAFSANRADEAIRLDAPFVQGMSGGCTLDGDGRLVGIVVGSDLKTSGISSDGEYLQEMIRAFCR